MSPLFGPRSRQRDISGGTLFYFVMVEWVPSLSFRRFGPRSRWDLREGSEDEKDSDA